MKTKNQKGITLIALIITIIVMLILVGVSVSVALNTGLFSTAQGVAKNTQLAAEAETALLNGKINIKGTGETNIDDYVASLKGDGGGEYEEISVETDCVGYYVDLGGEEGPEGVVYIDIANTESSSDYTITNETEGLKEYYVSAEDYEGAFGTADVLSLVPGTSGTERFYVMALEDSTSGSQALFYWYYNAATNGISEYETLTGKGIGAGKTNTSTMLTEWNATTPTYGAKHELDMWGLVEAGWYIPSKDEWKAFDTNLGVSRAKLESFELREYYFSSTLTGSNTPYYWNPGLFNSLVNDLSMKAYVRLGTNF